MIYKDFRNAAINEYQFLINNKVIKKYVGCLIVIKLHYIELRRTVMSLEDLVLFLDIFSPCYDYEFNYTIYPIQNLILPEEVEYE